MYTIHKTQTFRDQLELKDDQGASEIINVKLDMSPKTIQNYRKAQIALLELQKRLKDQPKSVDAMEEMGEAVVGLFTLVFGEANTQKILAFYEDDFVAMCADLFVYLQNVVAPAIQRAAKERSKELKRRFK